ncbi:hypothetical protein B0H13DRAFT_2341077 [Mycena leptocephala]|nr:hypothetical protein B0H13DRAFT_2341077 [Mycena leptocephala]
MGRLGEGHGLIELFLGGDGGERRHPKEVPEGSQELLRSVFSRLNLDDTPRETLKSRVYRIGRWSLLIQNSGSTTTLRTDLKRQGEQKPRSDDADVRRAYSAFVRHQRAHRAPIAPPSPAPWSKNTEKYGIIIQPQRAYSPFARHQRTHRAALSRPSRPDPPDPPALREKRPAYKNEPSLSLHGLLDLLLYLPVNRHLANSYNISLSSLSISPASSASSSLSRSISRSSGGLQPAAIS